MIARVIAHADTMTLWKYTSLLKKLLMKAIIITKKIQKLPYHHHLHLNQVTTIEMSGLLLEKVSSLATTSV